MPIKLEIRKINLNCKIIHFIQVIKRTVIADPESLIGEKVDSNKIIIAVIDTTIVRGIK